MEGLDNMLIKQLFKFEIKANNNQVEYETLITGMTITLKMGVLNLKPKNDPNS